MKRFLLIILAVAMVAALFAGCGNNTQPSDDAGSTPAQETTSQGGSQETPAATEAVDDNYSYAAGKYEVGEDGFPLSTYSYELPLSKSGDVLTYYSTCMYPQYIPNDGYDTIGIVSKEEEMTGVNIEYTMANYDTWAESYAIMLASDDLADLLCKPFDNVTNMTKEEFVDDGYIIDLYPYRDYMPNYMYYTNYFGKTMGDTNVYNTVFADSDSIYGVYSFYDSDYDTFGSVLRGDWLDQLGIDYHSIESVDDLLNVFNLFQTQIDECEYPWLMTCVADSTTFFGCYDTETMLQYFILPDGVVRDGVVTMPYYNDEDYTWISTLNDWFNKGYIDPGWTGYMWPQSYEQVYANGTDGFSSMQCSEVKSYEELCSDPDCTYVPVKQVVRYDGQTIHLDYGSSHLNYAHTCVSTECENVELACTWMDWRYSDEGAFFYSYGPEGQVWEYDDNGEPAFTDFALNNPDGIPLSYIYNFYMGNFLLGHGLELFERRYCFPGGETYFEYFDYWASANCDSAWNWPSGLTFNTEESEILGEYSADLVTYLSENLTAFVDGSKALTTWDKFVEDLLGLGWKEVEAVYQEGYDNFMAAR